MIYAVNTAVWLGELGCTLADVPDDEVARLSQFDFVWLIGVWARSPIGRELARAAFPQYPPEDVGASPYAIRGYVVDESLGGIEGLRSFRKRLRAKLILDFVPNHLALDHPWTIDHPERFVYAGGRIAHGRDPYFPPWTDTVQLDHRRRDTREAMTGELLRVADLCDGVRCDMAMLVLRDVFTKTWGGAWHGPEFWTAAITAVRERHRRFVFIAEAYWDLEPVLLRMGFDFAYDKALYDRLLHGTASDVRDHLAARGRLVRFIENHDEERAATAFQPPERHRAAAAIALASPGLPLVHDGQLEGRRVRIPIQLVRRPPEEPDGEVADFYARLLSAIRETKGDWQLLDVESAWEGNESHRAIVAFVRGDALVVVNFASHWSQGYVRLRDPRLAGKKLTLRDVLHDITYERNGDELVHRGLYIDISPYFQHFFRYNF